MSTELSVKNLLPALTAISDPQDLVNTGYSLGIHATETDQRYVCGQRLIRPDGRVYRYGLATTGGVDAYHGCMSLADDVIGETLAVAAAIGDRQFSITETGFTKDQLIGAYAFIYASTGGQLRYITGNEESGATYTICYVSEPFDQAIAGTEYCEMFENPWTLCTKTATNKSSCVGVPACTAASGYYFWAQTWGPCVVSPGHTLTPSGDAREVGFGTNGAVFLMETYYAHGLQRAGFVLNYNSDNGPLIMLQIAI